MKRECRFFLPSFTEPTSSGRDCPLLSLAPRDRLTASSDRAGDLDRYLQEIARDVSALLNSAWTIVTLRVGERGSIVAGSAEIEDGRSGFTLHGTLAGEITRTGRAIAVEDARTDRYSDRMPENYLAYLGLPLKTFAGDCIGTICSFFDRPRRFTDGSLEPIEDYTERAAIALDNYRLYREQQKLNNELQLVNERLREEIRERQEAEREVTRLAEIGELAAKIVHEVRNPLTTIFLGLTALKGADLAETGRIRLALALEEADRLQRLLGDILLYAKSPSLRRERLEVNRLIARILDTIGDGPTTEPTIEFIPSSVEAWISGDSDRLKQVLINLLDNAREVVNGEDTVTVRVTLDATSRYVSIRFHNGGEPIPSETLSAIGTPFYTTKPEGNGLGFAIARSIVEAHGGELTIESALGTGTEVSARFPLLF